MTYAETHPEDPRLERPRCGTWMPSAKEPCARYPGHKWEHRSKYAIENARAAQARDYVPVRR